MDTSAGWLLGMTSSSVSDMLMLMWLMVVCAREKAVRMERAMFDDGLRADHIFA